MHRSGNFMTLPLLVAAALGFLWLPDNARGSSGAKEAPEARRTSIQDTNYAGIARKPDSDQILYREIHCVDQQGSDNALSRSETVFYINPDGNRIATKRLDSNFEFIADAVNQRNRFGAPEGIKARWVPQYEFVHHEFGLAEGLAYERNTVLLQRREGKDARRERKQLTPDAGDSPAVADAGFDAFIRDNLETFARGESLHVTYLSAPRLSSLEFTLEPKNIDDRKITISMYPRNFVIRLLVDPITVVYGRDNGRLLSFQGLTNVPESPDENFVALIQYQYGEDLDAFCN